LQNHWSLSDAVVALVFSTDNLSPSLRTAAGFRVHGFTAHALPKRA
jgi:hypothetical protein